MQQDIHLAKFRFNQQFRTVNAEEFLKQLFSSSEVQEKFKPLEGLKVCQDLKFKQINCSVLNMQFFDCFEELGIVNKGDGRI